MRIAVLVKQVPKFEAMELGPDGRLRREGVELELNPYCRRAVSKGVELARASGGTCTVITLGPPAAEDSLREAIAWGADDGVLVTDPASGSVPASNASSSVPAGGIASHSANSSARRSRMRVRSSSVSVGGVVVRECCS